MQCLYCGTPLAILRMLANGSFCSDEHRDLYESETVHAPSEYPLLTAAPPLIKPQPRSGPVHRSLAPLKPNAAQLSCMLPPPAKVKTASFLLPFGSRAPLPFEPVRRTQDKHRLKAAVAPVAPSSQPLFPLLNIHPRLVKPVSPDPPPLAIVKPRRLPVSYPIDFSTQKLREIWSNAPGDVKVIATVIPVVLLLTLNAAGPKVYRNPVAMKASSQPMVDGLLTRQWRAIRKSIAERAGFDYSDDFRSGLDAWTSGSHSQVNWSYDNMGFVRPGGLALFRPTLQLADYEVEFIGRFEHKGLGFAFRAADTNNYQAVKLVVTKFGPLPEVHVVHYTVLSGREGPKSEKLLPVALSADTFFTVHLDVRGNDFALMVQNKMADFWSDGRLKTGGVGFFCGRGEQARVRRVEVSHQNDTLGRFCAFIASERAYSNNGS